MSGGVGLNVLEPIRGPDAPEPEPGLGAPEPGLDAAEPVRVIGVGTRQGDDAAGLLVAEGLETAALPPGVTVLRCERPGPDLLDALAGARAVVLVDAMRSGAPPGTVLRVPPERLRTARGFSSHALGVAEALSLAEALGRRPARVALVGIETGPARSGEPSARVRAGVGEAIALALTLVAELADDPLER